MEAMMNLVKMMVTVDKVLVMMIIIVMVMVVVMLMTDES